MPLRHNQPSGTTIRLAVAVLSPIGTDSQPPLILLGGGPGQALVPDATTIAAQGQINSINLLRANRKLVLLDQRGTAASQPALTCPEETKAVASLPSQANSAQEISAVTAADHVCGARLAKITDLSDFGTVEDAADLDTARRALGYGHVDIFATSYGTDVALEAARNNPSWLHAIVLSSPLPAQANFIVDAPSAFDHALQNIFATCAKTAACNKSYPALASRLNSALEYLQAHPASLAVSTTGGRTVTTTFSAGDAANDLFNLLYTHADLEVVPAVIDDLAKHHYGPFATITTDSTDAIARGLDLSVLCSEEAAYSTPDQIQKKLGHLSLTARLFAENNLNELPLYKICKTWPTTKAPPITFTTVHTNIPALIVTGSYDPATPPAYGQLVHADLPHSYLITYSQQGHSPLLGQGPCAIHTMLSFLKSPTKTPTNTCPGAPTTGS